MGHKAAECREPKNANPVICEECGGQGHTKEACWELEKNAHKRPKGWKSRKKNGEEASGTCLEIMIPSIEIVEDRKQKKSVESVEYVGVRTLHIVEDDDPELNSVSDVCIENENSVSDVCIENKKSVSDVCIEKKNSVSDVCIENKTSASDVCIEKKARKPASVERGRVSERGNACAQPSLKTLKKVYDQNSDENSGEGFSVMASAGHSWGVPEQRSWTMS